MAAVAYRQVDSAAIDRRLVGGLTRWEVRVVRTGSFHILGQGGGNWYFE